MEIFGDGFGETVAERPDGSAAGRDSKAAADAVELFAGEFERPAAAEQERQQAADSFEVAISEIAAFAELGKDFEFSV